MQAITRKQAIDFLESSPVAHIGVVVDGDPYVTPMSFVVDGDRILFRTKPGRRFAAIESHPTVSIEVSSFDTSDGDWMSVVVRGSAYEARDDPTIALTVEKLFDKYRDALGSPLGRGGIQPFASFPHVVVVDIEEITGMTSTGPFGVKVRPGRL